MKRRCGAKGRPTVYKAVRGRVRECLLLKVQCRRTPYICSTCDLVDVTGRGGSPLPCFLQQTLRLELVDGCVSLGWGDFVCRRRVRKCGDLEAEAGDLGRR